VAGSVHDHLPDRRGKTATKIRLTLLCHMGLDYLKVGPMHDPETSRACDHFVTGCKINHLSTVNIK
jgi:hypothetical protein